MISGFHSTQSTIVGRAVQNEKHTIITFSLPMIIEGAFAMIWALVAMSLFNNKPDLVPSDPNQLNPSAVLGPLTQGKLGVGFGDFILIVIAMEAVTTGDTALRSTRLIVADFIKVDQKPMKKRLLVAIPIFAISIGLLFVVLYKSAGFAYMWQYFA
jgi:carbon starvation protein CstA